MDFEKHVGGNGGNGSDMKGLGCFISPFGKLFFLNQFQPIQTPPLWQRFCPPRPAAHGGCCTIGKFPLKLDLLLYLQSCF